MVMLYTIISSKFQIISESRISSLLIFVKSGTRFTPSPLFLRMICPKVDFEPASTFTLEWRVFTIRTSRSNSLENNNLLWYSIVKSRYKTRGDHWDETSSSLFLSLFHLQPYCLQMSLPKILLARCLFWTKPSWALKSRGYGIFCVLPQSTLVVSARITKLMDLLRPHAPRRLVWSRWSPRNFARLHLTKILSCYSYADTNSWH